MTRSDASAVEWAVAPGLTAYDDALAQMEARADAVARGQAREKTWLVEHPALYTAGTSAKDADLVDARFPVHRVGRGGQYTYHGPGQRVAYVMLDLDARGRDIRKFVCALEDWLIGALAGFGVAGERRAGRVGVWVARPDKARGPGGDAAEDKVAAIGVRVRRWATFHGVSLNVAPDLSHFSGIVPCGIAQSHLGVTSLADLRQAGLARAADMDAVDAALKRGFTDIFGAVD